MPVTMCVFYNDFKGANNTWQQGHFRPASFEYAVHEAQMEIFNELRKDWGTSQVNRDLLRYFIRSGQIAIQDMPRGGVIPYPKDYSLFSSFRFLTSKDTTEPKGVKCKDLDIIEAGVCRPLREEEKAELTDSSELIEKSIELIDNKRWGGASEDKFIPMDVRNPGGTQLTEGFKIIPRELGYIILDYLSTPVRPKIVYTGDSDDGFVCDDTKCTNLLWGDEILPELMSRVKTKYASFISNPQKYAEGVKETESVGS